MSDSSTTPDQGAATDDGSAGNVDIKALRDAADQGKKDRAENEALKRELAFAKAGVDTDSKIGSMLFKTYDGDLEDVEALQAEWAELNPAQATPPPAQQDPSTGDTPPPEGFQNPEGQQQHRDGAQGQPAGETPPQTLHPIDQAYEAFHSNKALPLEDRQEQALGIVFDAYFKGDSRVMLDRQAHTAAAMANAPDDSAPGI